MVWNSSRINTCSSIVGGRGNTNKNKTKKNNKNTKRLVYGTTLPTAAAAMARRGMVCTNKHPV